MGLLRSSIFGLLFAGLLAIPISGSALPLPTGAPNSNNDGLPDLYDVFNLFTGSHFTSNAQLPAPLAGDETFTLGPDAGAFLISSTADFSNDFGYCSDAACSTPGSQHALFTDVTGFKFHGAPFAFAPFGVTGQVGLYLDANGENVWHSQSGLDAARSEFDHLVAYAMGDIEIPTKDGSMRVTNAIMLGWEDLNPGDADYDDLVAIIGDTPITAVPEPATIVYLGGALAAFAVRRRVRSFARV